MFVGILFQFLTLATIMTSKLTFRARMLDATKPLSIYQAVDLPELAIDYVVNRAVSALPTGME
jgi:hypothetical protein